MRRTADDVRNESDAAHWCWDTVNTAELAQLDRWKCPPHLHLSSHAGSGCAFDPPGYPTYFLRQVYTEEGNNPTSGPQQVIAHPVLGLRVVLDSWRGVTTWEQSYSNSCRLMLRLWARLPLGHVRTRGWLRMVFVHWKHCYREPKHQRGFGVWPEPEWSKTLLIWPGGTFGHTPYGEIRKVGLEIELAQKYGKYDSFEEKAKAKFVADIQEENARVTRVCEAVATLDNRSAVTYVRQWYPEFTPEPWLLAEDLRHGGQWWERRSKPPPHNNCPGFGDSRHPANTTWCQVCGWQADGQMAEEDKHADV